MRVTLNISKPEAECLSRIVTSYMNTDMPLNKNFKFACMPFLESLKEKIDALIKKPEKVSINSKKQTLK